MRNFTVAIINGSYIFQLQSNHHQADYVGSIQGNHIPLVYKWLKITSGRYLSLTYESI